MVSGLHCMYNYVHVPLYHSMQNQGRIKEFYVYICDSEAWDAFLGVFYGYKAILQVYTVFTHIHVHTYNM